MARDVIAPDSTLEDVESTLLDAEKLVANVLWTMGACRKENGNALVRIGITGEGKAPFHKVTFLSDDGVEQLYGSYFGRNKDETYQVHERTWSSRAMTYEEVQTQLGRIRGFVKKPMTRPL
jgi:hypothetical protein